MTAPVFCSCGQMLDRSLIPPGVSFACPSCGVDIDFDESDVTSGQPKEKSILTRMFETLLDAQTIRRLLGLGGGLFVLGLVIWLVSLGVFENKLILAATLGAGSLAILGSGWYVTLFSRYRIAGQAITFLGCVVLPLNLWFYHAQDILRVGQNLWAGGLVCALLYVATVYFLRDPAFMYAVEVGITLTLLLFLGDLNVVNDVTWLSMSLALLAMMSIHARAAFAESAQSGFSRKRYGMPLFWSGHVQLIAAALLLVISQLSQNLPEHAQMLTGDFGVVLPQSIWLVVGTWLVVAYLYFYSASLDRQYQGFIALGVGALLGSMWPVVNLLSLSREFQTLIFAGVGLLVLAVTRLMETSKVRASLAENVQGRTEALATCGNAVVSIALVAEFLQGLGRLSAPRSSWSDLTALALSCGCALVAALISSSKAWRRWYVIAALWLAGLAGAIVAMRSTLGIWRKWEIGMLVIGAFSLATGYVNRFREKSHSEVESTKMSLWFGSVFVCLPLLIAVIVPRVSGSEFVMVDELAMVAFTLVLLTTGVGWQIKSTTLCGGAALVTYLLMVVGALAYRPNLAAGVYLAVGGGVLFAAGVALSICRVRLLRLPERMANREGLFRVLDWR